MKVNIERAILPPFDLRSTIRGILSIFWHGMVSGRWNYIFCFRLVLLGSVVKPHYYMAGSASGQDEADPVF